MVQHGFACTLAAPHVSGRSLCERAAVGVLPSSFIEKSGHDLRPVGHAGRLPVQASSFWSLFCESSELSQLSSLCRSSSMFLRWNRLSSMNVAPIQCSNLPLQDFFVGLAEALANMHKLSETSCHPGINTARTLSQWRSAFVACGMRPL
jgi:hypothetical protein